MYSPRLGLLQEAVIVFFLQNGVRAQLLLKSNRIPTYLWCYHAFYMFRRSNLHGYMLLASSFSSNTCIVCVHL